MSSAELVQRVVKVNTYLDTHSRFSAIFYKGDNFRVFLFACLYTIPLLKGSVLKRKNLLPLRALFCLEGWKRGQGGGGQGAEHFLKFGYP